MNKKFLSILLLLFVICSCSTVKKDYKITDIFPSKKPLWVDSLAKYESKNQDNSNKYKYFVGEGESVSLQLCRKSAIADRNQKIASEINNLVDTLYSSIVDTVDEDTISVNTKKNETKNIISSKLVGVEEVEVYWEKRQYSTDLGSKKDKVNYVCYNLGRVKKSIHDNIIQEMVDKWINNIKDNSQKNQVSNTLHNEAQNIGIELSK